MLGDNYIDTAYRMYDSSLQLKKVKQWLSACYLAGYIVECYCKLTLQCAINQGYVLSDFRLMSSHKLSDMGNEIIVGLPGIISATYCVDISAVCSNLANGWGVSLRYASDSHGWNNEQMAENVTAEIDKLMEIILNMELDGVI